MADPTRPEPQKIDPTRPGPITIWGIGVTVLNFQVEFQGSIYI